MFEFYCLSCEYAELHAPSSYGLDELLFLPYRDQLQTSHTREIN